MWFVGKIGEYICESCCLNLNKFEINKQVENKFFVYRYEDVIRKSIIDYKFNEKSYIFKKSYSF